MSGCIGVNSLPTYSLYMSVPRLLVQCIVHYLKKSILLLNFCNLECFFHKSFFVALTIYSVIQVEILFWQITWESWHAVLLFVFSIVWHFILQRLMRENNVYKSLNFSTKIYNRLTHHHPSFTPTRTDLWNGLVHLTSRSQIESVQKAT